MSDLEAQLKKAQKQRNRLIVTDGVFSMDGNVAPLRGIMALAGKYNAMVMVDESHSAGMVGSTGRGITEFFGVMGDVEIMTGTLGKSFGGAMGGFTTGRKEIIEILRQRSRPYLFSNSIPPIVAAAGIKALDIVTTSNVLQDKLRGNTEHFIIRVTSLGFDIKPTRSAICAVMLYDARLSREFAAKLLEEGIYVSGFCYPVVPKGEARIRVQLSAAHTREQIDRAVDAFEKIGRQLRAIK
jgi:glycine C-acetyltransferase